MRSSGSLLDFQKDGEVLDRYYDALIIHDPLRAVLIVPHHTVVEADLDRINDAWHGQLRRHHTAAAGSLSIRLAVDKDLAAFWKVDEDIELFSEERERRSLGLLP